MTCARIFRPASPIQLATNIHQAGLEPRKHADGDLAHAPQARARSTRSEADLPEPVSPMARAEFSLTQIRDCATYGRSFFEELIRENISLGRPEQVRLIFARKMQRKTTADGPLPDRIITAGVVPSLHVYYKNTHLKNLKQY
jgi:hypothetical protein